jgi:hypothetical protein
MKLFKILALTIATTTTAQAGNGEHILYVFWGDAYHGVATSNQEFGNLISCNSAKKSIDRKMYGERFNFESICVPKAIHTDPYQHPKVDNFFQNKPTPLK